MHMTESIDVHVCVLYAHNSHWKLKWDGKERRLSVLRGVRTRSGMQYHCEFGGAEERRNFS